MRTQQERTRPASDLVDRDCCANRPNILWLADITHLPTWAGFLYLAMVLDAFSRRIVGWAIGNRFKAQLVLDALNMALGQRTLQTTNNPVGTRLSPVS